VFLGSVNVRIITVLKILAGNKNLKGVLNMTKTTLKVIGMSCAHCVSKVEKALQELQGVEMAKVNMKKEKAKVKDDEIVQTKHNRKINECNKSLKRLLHMNKSTIKMIGMICAHCVSKVKKPLQELQGVEMAKVNLKKETAKVKYDDIVQTENNFMSAIEEAGYKAQRME